MSRKIIVIILLVFALVGSYLIVILSKKSDTSLPKDSPESRQTQEAINLNSFTSSKGGYTFDYPREWIVKEMDDGTVWVGPPEEKSEFPLVVLIIFFGEIAAKDALPSTNSMQEVVSKEVIVNGKTASQLTIKYTDAPGDAHGRETIVTYVDGPTQTYQIQLAKPEIGEYLSGYNLILNSFKITNN